VAAEAHTTLREAASCAYEAALAPFHTAIVKVSACGAAAYATKLLVLCV
jgi:hypothetical protein